MLSAVQIFLLYPGYHTFVDSNEMVCLFYVPFSIVLEYADDGDLFQKITRHQNEKSYIKEEESATSRKHRAPRSSSLSPSRSTRAPMTTATRLVVVFVL